LEERSTLFSAQEDGLSFCQIVALLVCFYTLIMAGTSTHVALQDGLPSWTFFALIKRGNQMILKTIFILMIARCGVSQELVKAKPPVSFEVASVRVSPPGHGPTSVSPPGASTFVATNIPLKVLIQLAYEVDAHRIAGKPEWFNVETYDVSAKVEGGAGLSYKQLKEPLQRLLADRFHLVLHRETREMNGYALVVEKGGPKFEVSKGGSATPTMVRDELKIQNMPLTVFAVMLGKPVDRPIVDKTGLAGNYDLDLKFSSLDATDSQLPSIFTALREQLGLRLNAEKIPVDMLVVDHVDTVPTEN
jgi:uncharacterized protein (TIGR03435 family)